MKLFKTKEKPTIYTMETCNYCTMVKEKLTEENISFIEKDIKENKKDWENVLRKTGFANTPTIVFKNNYFAPMRDFANPNQLVVMLSELTKKSLSELDILILSFERMKTMNYYMSESFSAMQAALVTLDERIQPLNVEKKDEHKSND